MPGSGPPRGLYTGDPSAWKALPPDLTLISTTQLELKAEWEWGGLSPHKEQHEEGQKQHLRCQEEDGDRSGQTDMGQQGALGSSGRGRTRPGGRPAKASSLCLLEERSWAYRPFHCRERETEAGSECLVVKKQKSHPWELQEGTWAADEAGSGWGGKQRPPDWNPGSGESPRLLARPSAKLPPCQVPSCPSLLPAPVR